MKKEDFDSYTVLSNSYSNDFIKKQSLIERFTNWLRNFLESFE